MNINLELYRIFLEVAKNKSFSSAANQLFITQPAVSQAIKQLETSLGTQLFARTPKGVLLTEGGTLLLGYAEHALGILATGERRVGELKSLNSGNLRIGASDTLCRHYLLQYLSEFHHQYPNITISVTNRTSGETAQLLESGKADLGFVNLPLDIKPTIAIQELMQIQDCFVYGKKYFNVFDASPVPVSELQNYLILMLERQSSSRRYLDGELAALGIVLTPQIELGSLDLLLEFATAGLGIAAVTQEYAKEYIESGRLRVLNIEPTIPKRSIGMIYHKKMPLSAAAQRFLEVIRSA